MKLALAQINPTVGDIAGNAVLIARFTERAREAGADLVVFPELCLTGYPPRDLLLQEGFVDDALVAAYEVGRRNSVGITMVFGLPMYAGGLNDPTAGPGEGEATVAVASQRRRRGISNGLLAFADGAVTSYYDKRLLPTYDVFDEDRYFVPGDRPAIITVGGVRVGLSICEDLWRGEDVGFAHRYATQPDPVLELVSPLYTAGGGGGARGAQMIVNPSASPFALGKGRRHREILRKHAVKHGIYVAGVNQVGGNDELIFDGHAAVYDPRGELIAAAPGFVEDLLVVEVPDRPTVANVNAEPVHDPLMTAEDAELVYRALVLGVRDYVRKTGFNSAVMGLSGGIDSAVTAVIAAAALGPKQVLGIAMPGPYSSPGSVTDAEALARNLGVEFLNIPIAGPFDGFLAALRPPLGGGEAATAGITEENLQSRIRGSIVMAISNRRGHLPLTTGNKSELAVGYCTLYGDMNGGLAVLSDLSKGWVYRLAKWINANPEKLGFAKGPTAAPIPESSITKPPSAELRANQCDQDTLPPYELLDAILERYVEGRQSPARIVEELGAEPRVVAEVVRMIDNSEFKRKQAALGLKVTGVAFGSGRRMPIAQRYRPERRLQVDEKNAGA